MDLTSPECSKLVAALTDTSDSKLYLQHVPNLKGMSSFFTVNDANVAIVALITSKSPVIISAPPPHDSALSKGKHMFCNLAINYLGPSRLSNLSAMRIKRTKSQKVATIDVNIGESGVNDSDGIEEAPGRKYSKSATTSATKLLGVYPPQRSSKKKAMATSSVITLSSGLMSETELSGDDYVPGQESCGVNSDTDMEDGEVSSKTNTIRDVDSEYEQEPLSRKRKAKGPEVGSAKQKSSVPPLDSRGQTSKQSKTVTFKDLKAHTTGTKRRRIPLSPMYVSSEEDMCREQKQTEVPDTAKALAPPVISNATHRSAPSGPMQKAIPDPRKKSNTAKALVDSTHRSVPSGSTQKAGRSDVPDPHKRSTNIAQVLVPIIPAPTHCTIAPIDSDNMHAAVSNAVNSTVSSNARSPDAPGNLAGISQNIQLPCLPDGIMDRASTPLVSAVRCSDQNSVSGHSILASLIVPDPVHELSCGAPAHETLDNKRDTKQDQGL